MTRGNGNDKNSGSEALSKRMSSLNIKEHERQQKRSRSDSTDEATLSRQQKHSRSNSEDEHNRHRDIGGLTVISSRDKILSLPQPPSPGKAGRSTSLKVNCFRVHCQTSQISQYQITFDPPLPDDSSIFKQRIIYENFDELQKIFGVFIFDNMKLWALKRVDNLVRIESEKNLMEIRFIKSVDMRNAPYDEFSQIIHIIFQRATKNSNLTKIGRNYYDKNKIKDEEFVLKEDGLRLFRGYSMNIDQTVSGLQLTVDISHRVISLDSIAGLMDSIEDSLTPGNSGSNRGRHDRGRGDNRSMYRGSSVPSRDSYRTSSGDDRVRNNSDALKRKAEEQIIGRSVITTYRMRNWRIDEIDWTQNIDSTFSWCTKTGETKVISYRDYFYENYRLKLTNERYGMLVNLPKVRNTKTRRMKGPDRFVLPPEACFMTGISMEMKSDFRLMKRIRDIVSLTPPQRFRGIGDIVGLLNQSMDSSGYSSGSVSSNSREEREQNDNYLKIDIEPNPLNVKGRCLDQNYLSLKSLNNNSTITIKSHELMGNWRRAGFINSPNHTISRWIVLHESRDGRMANQLISEVMNAAKPYRILKPPYDMIEVRTNPRGGNGSVFAAWRNKIEEMIERVQSLQLIVVLIPKHFRSDEVYSAVKTATLLHNKRLIPSQCIKAMRFEPRAQKSLPSVIGSTLKQILTKRGNIPWVVNFNIKGKFKRFSENTLLCGIDVNHDNKRNRSTAGICVSGDRHFSTYDTYISIGSAGRENIHGAEKCMVKSLLNFYATQKKMPAHVVVYRDGVSNSELTSILKTEVKSFRNAFRHKEILKRAAGDYEPKLTFVVVQKRVSLRIFNTRLESGAPGTVVDSGITSSRFWDFYMLTTSPPRGKTSRPTRYVVVYDDFGFSNDDLQAFTNQLCHTYYNFPGPIRVPAPVQIAHQVAYLYGTIVSDPDKGQVYTPKCKGKAYYL